MSFKLTGDKYDEINVIKVIASVYVHRAHSVTLVADRV